MLVAATGPVIHKVDAKELVTAGVLSRPKIRFVEVKQSVSGYDWHSVYTAGVVESKVRNAVVCSIISVAAKPLLLFVKEIAHGQTLMRELLRSGVRAEFVHGAHDTASRSGAIKRLRRGDTDVLVTSSIFDAGIDIPEVRAVVIAAGGKSVISALQRLGRGMRVTADKTDVELWDIDDRGNRWLADHSEQRLHTYTGEGFDVTRLSSDELDLARRSGENLENDQAL
jgi:superfamily II DNA or RNA helicase